MQWAGSEKQTPQTAYAPQQGEHLRRPQGTRAISIPPLPWPPPTSCFGSSNPGGSSDANLNGVLLYSEHTDPLSTSSCQPSQHSTGPQCEASVRGCTDMCSSFTPSSRRTKKPGNSPCQKKLFGTHVGPRAVPAAQEPGNHGSAPRCPRQAALHASSLAPTAPTLRLTAAAAPGAEGSAANTAPGPHPQPDPTAPSEVALHADGTRAAPIQRAEGQTPHSRMRHGSLFHNAPPALGAS